MSYHLIDFSKENINFSFDNIIIGKKIKIDQDSSKYYIYYQLENYDTPKEIYLKLPKIRLIYNLSGHKYNQLSIPLYPNCDSIDNFIKFIKLFEDDIIECFEQKKINKEFRSIINKKNNLYFIKSYLYDDNVKITSDLKDVNTINDFKINGQIEIIIKISYIWNKQNNYGLSSQIYQIKYWGTPEQHDINFIDIEPQKNFIFRKIEEPLPYVPLNIPKQTPLIIPNKMEQQSIKFVLNPADLKSAINKLKPPVINDDD